MSEPPVLLRRDDGPVVTLVLNRPERRNALSRALVAALSDALDGLASEPGTRVLVLAGAGSAFCAGMDLREATETLNSEEAQARSVADSRAIGHLVHQVHRFPRPTIAQVDGAALGGGAGLALACDLVVMSDRARIGFPEVTRGLVPAIVVHDVVRQLGDKRARQLLLTGRILTAAESLSWGLANQVAAADRCGEEALAMARELLGAAPGAIETTKRLIDEATLRPGDLQAAAAVSAAVRVGPEAVEGMRAFLERRQPRWDVRNAG